MGDGEAEHLLKCGDKLFRLAFGRLFLESHRRLVQQLVDQGMGQMADVIQRVLIEVGADEAQRALKLLLANGLGAQTKVGHDGFNGQPSHFDLIFCALVSDYRLRSGDFALAQGQRRINAPVQMINAVKTDARQIGDSGIDVTGYGDIDIEQRSIRCAAVELPRPSPGR